MRAPPAYIFQITNFRIFVWQFASFDAARVKKGRGDSRLQVGDLPTVCGSGIGRDEKWSKGVLGPVQVSRPLPDPDPFSTPFFTIGRLF